MSAPVVAVPETPVVEPTPVAGPAADDKATPAPPADAAAAKAAADAKAEAAKSETARSETPEYAPTPKEMELRGNVKGLARALRTTQKEFADYRAAQEKAAAAAAPAKPPTVEEQFAALPRDKDADGKDIVKYGDDWMSPQIARDMLEGRRFREETKAEQEQSAREKREADLKRRQETVDKALEEMAGGVEAVVQQMVDDHFSNYPADVKSEMKEYASFLADKAVSAAGQQAMREGVDPLDVLVADGFINGVSQQNYERIKTVFGAFAEAQLNDNREHEEKHPVTTPKGQSAVEPDMTYEKMRQLPPAERRKILDRIKQRHK